MKAPFKYAIVLVLGLAVGFYAHGPLSLEKVARLNWLDEINVIINKALVAARPQAAVAPIDPARAELLDEDLDYRIAQRIASLDGWRSFLAAHGNGARAESARAEVERLLRPTKAPAPPTGEVSDGASLDAKDGSEIVGTAQPPAPEVAALMPDEVCKRDGDRLERLRSSPTSEDAARFANELSCEKLRPQLLGLMERLDYTAPAPPAAEVSNGASPDAKATSEAAGPVPPSAGTEVAALTPDEICKRDEDRLERLRSNPATDEAARFANELGCEMLRPQLLRLMESLDHETSTPAAAPPSQAVRVESAPDSRWSAGALPSKKRRTASSRNFQPRRYANACAFKFVCFRKAPAMPPILLALVGERPKNSTRFGRTPPSALRER